VLAKAYNDKVNLTHAGSVEHDVALNNGDTLKPPSARKT
jgi:hypothetical protein